MNNHCLLNMTHSWKIFKNKKFIYSYCDYLIRFRKRTKQERMPTQTLLKTDALEYWSRLRLRCNIADSISIRDISRILVTRIVKICHNVDCAINGQNITATIINDHRDQLHKYTFPCITEIYYMYCQYCWTPWYKLVPILLMASDMTVYICPLSI